MNVNTMTNTNTAAAAYAANQAEAKDLLKRIADGRPGISGPRFPKNMRRSDYCGP